MSQNELTKIKYAAVEVIRNGASSAEDIECGAVMGICRRKNDQNVEISFLAVVNSPSSIRLYNLTEYKIVTLDILDDATRYMTVYTNTEEDQKAAVQMVDKLVQQMAEINHLMANDPYKELIDVEHYDQMPDAVLEGNNLSDKINKDNDKTSTKTSSTSSSISSIYSQSTTNNTHTQSTVYTKQTPTVLNVKRKGKLPSTKKLSAMRDKVVQLATGQFKVNNLPVPKCDIVIEDKKKNVVIL